MGQQKQSTVQIIELGKTLVRELGFEDTTETLNRWMAHYLAELIKKAENANGKEKSKLEKECCDIILQIWKEREYLPHKLQPLSELKETISILNSLKQKESPFFGLPYEEQSEAPWVDFVDKINEAYKKTVRISVLFSLVNSNFEKSKLWKKLHEIELSEEENKIIDLLDELMSDYNLYFMSGKKQISIKDMTKNERIKYILKKLETLIVDQKVAFNLLSKIMTRK
jgi:hypothetical protein